MYYVLSLCGYEEYAPVWFESNKSKEEFQAAVKQVVSAIIGRALLDDDYIDGHTIVSPYNEEAKDRLEIQMSQLGFKIIKPDYEFTFEGECLYNRYNSKPSIYSDEDWTKILEHNKKVKEDSNKQWNELSEEQKKLGE